MSSLELFMKSFYVVYGLILGIGLAFISLFYISKALKVIWALGHKTDLSVKYVIVSIAFADLAPMIFRDDIGHEVAVLGLDKKSIISAGFVTIQREASGALKATGHGQSIGLKLSAREEDSAILTRFLNS